MTPRELILNARKAVESKNWDEVDQLYAKAIHILEKRKNYSIDSKEAFFSAKAEYLSIKPYLPDRESFEEFRNRILDAIRYLNECYHLNGKESDSCFSDMYDMMYKFIKLYGCRFPETDHHVIMSCPIQLNSDKFGSLGTSIGAFYEKALCSICKLDILDEKCNHIINQIYDDKQCVPIFVNYQPVHIALVDRPKDSRSRIKDIFYPKEMFLEKAQIDSSKVNLEDKLNIRCTRCREENIDPVLITPELFFEMQGLNISFGKKPIIKSKTEKMEKGKLYFSSSLSLDYQPV